MNAFMGRLMWSGDLLDMIVIGGSLSATDQPAGERENSEVAVRHSNDPFVLPTSVGSLFAQRPASDVAMILPQDREERASLRLEKNNRYTRSD